MRYVLFIFGLSIILSACTQQLDCKSQGYIQPTQCPQCNCPTQLVPEKEYLYIYFIDVGQGDASLIKYKDTEMLIDCGKNTQGDSVADFLNDRGVGELEYMLLTHPDADHIGGCDEILREIRTKVIITNGEQKDTFIYKELMDEIETQKIDNPIQVITARKQDSWSIGPAIMMVIQSNNQLDDSNDNSIVSKLIFNNVKILFTGDCSEQCEELALDKDLIADVLKVSHHGSKFATNQFFLEKVHARDVVISVGYNNYGHPSQEAIDRLSTENIIIHRTDYEGDITLRSDGLGYEFIK